MDGAKKQQMEGEQRKEEAKKRQLEGFAKSGKATGCCWVCNVPLTASALEGDLFPAL